MKKVIISIGIILVMLLILFFFVGARIADQQKNITLHIDDEHYQISEEAQSLHESLTIADWHNDVLLWDRSLLSENTHGHTDIPRLQKGNVTLQVFDAVTKVPKGLNYEKNSGDTDMLTMLTMANRWPPRTWYSPFQRTMYQSKKLHGIAERSEGALRLIKSNKELQQLLLDRTTDKSLLGGLLSLEGLQALEGDIENVNLLYEAGYRMFGLVHFYDNRVGGSSAGVDQYGLTEFGKEVIDLMNRKNIIIDLAHASAALIDDVLAYSDRPVVVSHTGVREVYDSPRNLSDQQIRAITAKGGLIGVGFWAGAIGSPSVEHIVQTMYHLKELVGVDYIALGSDWDGATTTYFDAAHLSVLTQALMDNGFSHDEIKKIMGGNQIAFLLRMLP